MAFQTGSASIDLSGSPWFVTTVVKLYVRRETDGSFGLYKDEACTQPYGEPAEMTVAPNQSTGLYFYIADASAADYKFLDGTGNDLPVKWLSSDTCPPSVTYGRILASGLAFSMKDFWQTGTPSRYVFDLEVEDGSGHKTTILSNVDRALHPVDPTIVQKGEEPPGGGPEPGPGSR